MPLYTHDCEYCEYIGETKHPLDNTIRGDLYVHFYKISPYVGIIVRYGNNGPDYTSTSFSLNAEEMLTDLLAQSWYANALRTAIQTMSYTHGWYGNEVAQFIQYGLDLYKEKVA